MSPFGLCPHSGRFPCFLVCVAIPCFDVCAYGLVSVPCAVTGNCVPGLPRGLPRSQPGVSDAAFWCLTLNSVLWRVCVPMPHSGVCARFGVCVCTLVCVASQSSGLGGATLRDLVCVGSHLSVIGTSTGSTLWCVCLPSGICGRRNDWRPVFQTCQEAFSSPNLV
mgnify:CR=1 FL=1